MLLGVVVLSYFILSDSRNNIYIKMLKVVSRRKFKEKIIHITIKTRLNTSISSKVRNKMIERIRIAAVDFEIQWNI